MMSPILKMLRDMPEFKATMKELLAFRPVIPEWKPGTKDETEVLMERLKYETGRKDGFDLLYLKLTGERPNG